MIETNSKSIIHTKFGNAQMDNGYYRISSRKEGNRGKMLHRLIFEDFYGEIPKGHIVHHKDGNKTNNCILNLQLIRWGTHTSLHNIGNTNMLGKKHSKESIKKMSESSKGQVFSETHRINMGKSHSKNKNVYGFYRVTQIKGPKYTNGFIWVYQYQKDYKRKKFYSTTLKGLKQKVIENGLEWLMIDEDKARATCEEHGYGFKELCS